MSVLPLVIALREMARQVLVYVFLIKSAARACKMYGKTLCCFF